LPATGEGGFEGFLRDAVAAIVRRHLNLVKSGPQGGIDNGTPPEDGQAAIGVEAKRYGAKNSLPLDQLKAKLTDAVQSRPDLDLIAFGATREITLNDKRQLAEMGEANGVGVVFLDWPASATLLPPLTTLCAMAPTALLDRIDTSQRPVLQAEIEVIRARGDFTEAAERLASDLTKPDLGYAAARRGMAAWVRRRLSNRNAALADLGGLSNILAPETKLVARPAANAALEQWMAATTSPLALLGDEGVGKSWAALAWWHARAGTAGEDLPLTLVIPAREVTDTNADELVARLLAQRTGLRTVEFWRRRVALWLRMPASAPLFLIVLDGLNENWNFEAWDQLVARFSAEPWQGRAAAVMSCRPDHWKARLLGLPRLQPRAREVAVQPFDNAELDDVLRLHGKTRDDLPPAILPLLRVPRLCDLAMRHADILGESGDITPERLVYEDWKDRLERHGSRLRLSDAEFKEIVSALGASLHARIVEGGGELLLTRSELTTELGANGGYEPSELQAAISEIVDGRWMPTSGRPNRFKINKDLAPFALALALVDQLRDVEDGGLENRLAAFVEPLREQDLLVDLLRAACTISLVDGACGRALKECLLKAWVHRQNFRSVDFEAFWRLIPTETSAFLRLAEEDWLFPSRGRHVDDVLIKSIANAAERWPAVAAQVVDWCTVWLGTHWEDPVAGIVINYDPNAEGVAERRQRTKDRRADWEMVAGTFSPPIPIRDGIKGRVPWLACRIIGVLSYLPRRLSVGPATAWAVSRAIMGATVERDQLSWLLRMGDSEMNGAAPSAIAAEADRLLAANHLVATQAAHYLLLACATPAAVRLVDGDPAPLARSWEHARAVYDVASNAIRWVGHDKPRTLGDFRDLEPYAVDPSVDVEAQLAVSLKAISDMAKQAAKEAQFQDRDFGLRHSEAALARWAPDALGRLHRRQLAEAGTQRGEALYRLAQDMPPKLLLLKETELSSLAVAYEVAAAETGEQAEMAARCLLIARLAGKSAAEQIALLSEAPCGPDLIHEHRSILSKPGRDDFATLADKLRADQTAKELSGWLWYLANVPLDDLPEGYPPLAALFSHPDPVVRRRAFEAACNARDKSLTQAMADTGWVWTSETDREEGIDGSILLAHSDLPREKLRRRIAPDALGMLALRDDADDDDLDALLEHIRSRIAYDTVRASRTIGGTFFILTHAVDKLAAARGSALIEVVEPFIAGRWKPRLSLFPEDFPYVDICRGLLRHHPEAGAAMWRVMHKELERGITSNDTFTLLPFEATDPSVFALRDLMWERAKTDEDLGKIATAIIEHKAQDWALARIAKDLDGPWAGQIAQGLWMAGFLERSDEADALWSGQLAAPPSAGWLADVHEQASSHYHRNAWARHWLELFIRERDPDRAHAHHFLFLKCADRRAYTWARQSVGEAWATLPRPWQIHWSLAWPAVCRAIEHRDKEWKETLFGTKITTHIQWPWR
jgi:hypothetical protein